MADTDGDGEVFGSSDDNVDQSSSVANARQDFRNIRRNDVEKVSEMLKRRCSCVHGLCFTQLRGREAEVADLRRGFYHLPSNRKELWPQHMQPL